MPTSLSERKLIIVTTDFFITFRKNGTSSVFFLKLGSLQMLPWNLRQLISYFFAFIIYSINLLKTARKTFANGNAIYPRSRTIIQITNDNSIFRKEGIPITRVIVLASSYLFLTEGMYTSGYITVNVTKCLKNWKNCILIQIKSDLLELFYIARYRWILWELYFYFISWMTVIISKFSVLYSKM